MTDTEIGGFLQFRRVSGDEIEILQLFTAPPYRRLGVARALVRHLTEHNRPAAIFLEVRDSNVAARQLYESEGFTLSGTRRSYYSQPEEDAIVLSLNVC